MALKNELWKGIHNQYRLLFYIENPLLYVVAAQLARKMRTQNA